MSRVYTATLISTLGIKIFRPVRIIPRNEQGGWIHLEEATCMEWRNTYRQTHKHHRVAIKVWVVKTNLTLYFYKSTGKMYTDWVSSFPFQRNPVMITWEGNFLFHKGAFPLLKTYGELKVSLTWFPFHTWMTFLCLPHFHSMRPFIYIFRSSCSDNSQNYYWYWCWYTSNWIH